jgi:cytochrome bd-type quinol oxidase subunit 1
MLLYLHAGFMITGLALMTAGVSIARIMRKKPWWLRRHRALGICGVLSIALGFSTAIYMVAQSGDEHFEVLHAYAGAVVILAVAATAILGQLQFTLKNRRTDLRNAHRWAGAMTLILVPLNMISGLVLAGYIPDMRSF